MERGWKPELGLVLDGAAPLDAVHPAAGLLAKACGAEPEQAAPSAATATVRSAHARRHLVGDRRPLHDRRPPAGRSRCSSLGASLCALGALMGRKYRTESNLRSNLYVVGIADSGSGKNHAREIVNELFFEAGLANHLGGNKIASGAGLLTALHRQPAILFQIDEFGMFLSAAADRKRSPRHITEILDNMTELYTAAGGIFLGAEYANQRRPERTAGHRPALPLCLRHHDAAALLGTHLQGANVVDGSLARFIILPTEDDYPDENLAAGLRHGIASAHSAGCSVSPRVVVFSRAICRARRPAPAPPSTPQSYR